MAAYPCIHLIIIILACIISQWPLPSFSPGAISASRSSPTVRGAPLRKMLQDAAGGVDNIGHDTVASAPPPPPTVTTAQDATVDGEFVHRTLLRMHALACMGMHQVVIIHWMHVWPLSDVVSYIPCTIMHACIDWMDGLLPVRHSIAAKAVGVKAPHIHAPLVL
jgi:hypothetical protein